MSLQIFFSYFGGKWRAAPHYPRPLYNHIVEPFAGAAGYALRYHQKQVTLLDLDPIICGVWDYLINVSADEVRRLSVDFKHVDEIDAPTEARHLVGFWLNKGTSHPCKTPGFWMRKACSGGYTTGGSAPSNWWGPEVRERIASQVDYIRHWRIHCAGYERADDVEATWFVDPPYQEAGQKYRFHLTDYTELAAWCRGRQGQVMVCENEGANWLPFRTFKSIKASAGKQKTSKGHRSAEVLWYYDSLLGEGF